MLKLHQTRNVYGSSGADTHSPSLPPVQTGNPNHKIPSSFGLLVSSSNAC
ncbi:hypothetical protein LguiA_012411 [Lonicera macranthoides]